MELSRLARRWICDALGRAREGSAGCGAGGARSGSDGDRPGYGPQSLFRGSSMPEDMAVLIAQAVQKAVQPLQGRISSLEDIDCPLEGEKCGPGGHAGHTFG